MSRPSSAVLAGLCCVCVLFVTLLVGNFAATLFARRRHVQALLPMSISSKFEVVSEEVEDHVIPLLKHHSSSEQPKLFSKAAINSVSFFPTTHSLSSGSHLSNQPSIAIKSTIPPIPKASSRAFMKSPAATLSLLQKPSNHIMGLSTPHQISIPPTILGEARSSFSHSSISQSSVSAEDDAEQSTESAVEDISNRSLIVSSTLLPTREALTEQLHPDFGPLQVHSFCNRVSDKCNIHARLDCLRNSFCGWCSVLSLCVDGRNPSFGKSSSSYSLALSRACPHTLETKAMVLESRTEPHLFHSPFTPSELQRFKENLPRISEKSSTTSTFSRSLFASDAFPHNPPTYQTFDRDPCIFSPVQRFVSASEVVSQTGVKGCELIIRERLERPFISQQAQVSTQRWLTGFFDQHLSQMVTEGVLTTRDVHYLPSGLQSRTFDEYIWLMTRFCPRVAAADIPINTCFCLAKSVQSSSSRVSRAIRDADINLPDPNAFLQAKPVPQSPPLRAQLASAIRQSEHTQKASLASMGIPDKFSFLSPVSSLAGILNSADFIIQALLPHVELSTHKASLPHGPIVCLLPHSLSQLVLDPTTGQSQPYRIKNVEQLIALASHMHVELSVLSSLQSMTLFEQVKSIHKCDMLIGFQADSTPYFQFLRRNAVAVELILESSSTTSSFESISSSASDRISTGSHHSGSALNANEQQASSNGLIHDPRFQNVVQHARVLSNAEPYSSTHSSSHASFTTWSSSSTTRHRQSLQYRLSHDLIIDAQSFRSWIKYIKSLILETHSTSTSSTSRNFFP